MQFKKYLVDKIILGEKTETRRPIKLLERLVMRDGLKTVLTASGRIKMQVGRDYAITYGRGKPCRWWHPERCELLAYEIFQDSEDDWLDVDGYGKLHITCTDISVEDVRYISPEDSVAEGFEDQIGFWKVWCGFYDKPAFKHVEFETVDKMSQYLMTRPDDLYQAFAYTFNVKE